ncbi:hypothetical protein E4U44_008106 [Claviceps purpurea]|nr:hypothetical protein E4U44_008106 [Claviceps purpurea]
MKFSTVLGTFALSTLQAYSAFASPVGPDAANLVRLEPLDAQSLESRDNEHCCVQTEIHSDRQSTNHRETEFDRQTAFYPYPVPWLKAVVASSGDCRIVVTQTNTPPSQGGCATWTFESKGCASEQVARAAVLPAEYCQSN